jgi:hypothetical protein
VIAFVGPLCAASRSPQPCWPGALLIAVAHLVRRALRTGASPGTTAVVDHSNMTVGQALSSPQFIVLAATFFACCAMHSGPIFHMLSPAHATYPTGTFEARQLTLRIRKESL